MIDIKIVDYHTHRTIFFVFGNEWFSIDVEPFEIADWCKKFTSELRHSDAKEFLLAHRERWIKYVDQETPYATI